MKKICILSAVNIRHMSLISLYTDILKKEGVEFDLIYMDKYDEVEEFPAKKIYRYRNVIDKSRPRWYKALQYWKFKRYATSIMSKNKYDFIIVWNDVAIFMFAQYLAKYYTNKYCLNIRDYCYEKNKWVYNRFKKVIFKSAFTTISSDGYKEFLPDYNYVNIHSLNLELLEKVTPRSSFRNCEKPIRIGFIGCVRYFENNTLLLSLFKDDDRFELHYYGTNANLLKSYAEENNIKNAFFYDTFPVNRTPEFLNKIDVINNLYGNERIGLTTALSIKLYHGIYTRLPILVCPDTYMEKITKQLGIGFVFSEFNEEYKNAFYEWYSSLNFLEFDKRCNNYIKFIKEQNQGFSKIVKEIVTK